MTETQEVDAYPAPVLRDGLWVFSREEFAETRWDYKAGEHVLFAGPTQNGKTSLAFELLDQCATPTLPAYVGVSKPKDPVTTREGERLGFRRVSEWPPPKKMGELFGGEKPRGYLVWPKFGDMDTDVERCAILTRKLLKDRYAAGMHDKKAILVMDDTVTKSKLMGLDQEMTTVLAMAGAMDIGLWVFVQKPTDSGRTALWSYGQSEHVFIAADPDRKNQLRYDEIGGVDPKILMRAATQLQPYEFIYVKRTGRFICIVGAK